MVKKSKIPSDLKRFGISQSPIPCTECWVREMAFDHNSKGVITKSYVLVNRYSGVKSYVNLYDGCTGVNFDVKKYSWKIKFWGEGKRTKNGLRAEEVELARSLGLLSKGNGNPYHRCLIVDCPVAILAGPPPGWVGGVIVEPSVSDQLLLDFD